MWTQDFTMITNTKRRSKEKVLEKWEGDWQRTSPLGGFMIANRLKPRWKLREHVAHTLREVFSRLMQCQTKHAFLGEYYARFIPDKTTRCTCSMRFQMQKHVIKKCPKYKEHRHILEEADVQLELGILLGTKIGLEAMAKFLARTGAFTKTEEACGEKTKPEEHDEKNDDEEERWWMR